MARKLRLQYEGAIYHVISRGNYRADVFAQERTKAAFLECLGEAALKAGWAVHAWCVMSNHYHLCVETPQANLVGAMQWLQATFSLRFNRYRGERGHVFQGRYKALPVEPDAAGAVCHYIHLNPVRAGIVGIQGLAKWPWTSVAMLVSGRRPAWFSPAAALEHAGGLKDTPAGRTRYLAYLDWLQADDAGKKHLQFERLSTDWAVGTPDFKKELLKEHTELVEALKARGVDDLREAAQALWRDRLAAYLGALKKSTADIRTSAKGAAWKVAAAAAMKMTTTAPNPWLAAALNMGSPFRLSRLASACCANPQTFQPYVDKVAKCKV
jgi:REP element-mobilizing transposase RayT